MTETETATPTLDQTRLATLARLGVTFVHDQDRGTPEGSAAPLLDTLDHLTIPFSAAEWCAIAMREGSEYVGGCCGNMGELQEIIQDVFRDSGEISNAQLLEIGQLARGHEGFEEFEPVDQADFHILAASWEAYTLKPWGKLGLIFSTFEPALKPRSYQTPQVPTEPRDSKERLDLLQRTLSRVTWMDMYETDEKSRVQHEASRLVLLARLLKPTRALLQFLETSELNFRGFAIVERGTDQVFENNRGMCLYATREAAEEVTKYWERSQPELAAVAEIVAARVKVWEGLKLRPEDTDES